MYDSILSLPGFYLIFFSTRCDPWGPQKIAENGNIYSKIRDSIV